MTGCPNGCARPYNADIAFVGRAPGKYALFVGGSVTGERLAGLQEKTVTLEDIPARVRGLIEEFVQNRQGDENFSNYWGRTHVNGPAPKPEQFHFEFAQRENKSSGWRGRLIDRASEFPLQGCMGKQHNKVEKRRRRLNYLKRKRSSTKPAKT